MLKGSVELTLHETKHKADITWQSSGSPQKQAPGDAFVMSKQGARNEEIS